MFYLSPPVFLRILEYYTGVLFLTTNRVGDFDEAFASRVHMSLYYPPLDLDSTMAIFDLNIKRMKKRFAKANRRLNIKEVPIGVFATDYWRDNPKARWNGRQIRNSCQTALALAEFEAQGGNHEAVMEPDATVHLGVKHFRSVADAYLGFMEYLKDIYGVDPEGRAKENLLRAGDRESQPPRLNPLAARRAYGGEALNQREPRYIPNPNPAFSSMTGTGMSQVQPSQYHGPLHYGSLNPPAPNLAATSAVHYQMPFWNPNPFIGVTSPASGPSMVGESHSFDTGASAPQSGNDQNSQPSPRMATTTAEPNELQTGASFGWNQQSAFGQLPSRP